MLPRRPSTAGFSLIELLIVVSLMGILAGILIPRFQPSIHEQLQGAGHLVAADLAYARSLAVANDSTYQIQFEGDTNQYVLKHDGANAMLDTLPASPFRMPNDLPNEQTTDLDELPQVGPTVVLTAMHTGATPPVPVDTVRFGPLGGTTRSEETVIWLSCGVDQSARFLSVHINPVTGLATVGKFTGTAPPAATLLAGGGS